MRFAQPSSCVEQEKMRVRPDITGLRRNEDRQVANEAHAKILCPISQRFKLPEEDELLELQSFDRIPQFILR